MRKNLIRLHFGGIAGFGLIAGTHILKGGYMFQLMQPGAFLAAICLPSVLALLLYWESVRTVVHGVLGEGPLPSEEALRVQGVLRSIRDLLVAGGVIGVLLGSMLVLAHLDDPSKLGAGIAVAWLAAFYMVIATELVVAPMIRQLAIRGLRTKESLASTDPASRTTAARNLLFSLVSAGGLVAAVHVIEGGALSQLTDPAGFLFVFAGLIFCFGWHGPSLVKSALLDTPTDDAPLEDLQVRLQVLLSLKTVTYGGASIGFMMGFMHMMAHLDNPQTVWTAVAGATSVWLFALLLDGLVLVPPRQRLQAECRARRGAETPLERAAHSHSLPVYVLVLVQVVLFLLALYSLEFFAG